MPVQTGIHGPFGGEDSVTGTWQPEDGGFVMITEQRVATIDFLVVVPQLSDTLHAPIIDGMSDVNFEFGGWSVLEQGGENRPARIVGRGQLSWRDDAVIAGETLTFKRFPGRLVRAVRIPY